MTNKIKEKFSELSGNEILTITLAGILGTLIGTLIYIWINLPD